MTLRAFRPNDYPSYVQPLALRLLDIAIFIVVTVFVRLFQQTNITSEFSCQLQPLVLRLLDIAILIAMAVLVRLFQQPSITCEFSCQLRRPSTE